MNKLPLSTLRRIARHARFVARYVQGTMGLEGQGVSQAFVEQMARDSFRESVQEALKAKEYVEP